MNHYQRKLHTLRAERLCRGEQCPKCGKENDPLAWGDYCGVTVWACRYCPALWYDGGLPIDDITRVQKRTGPLDTARARFRARFGILPHSGMTAGLRRTWHAMLCRALGFRPTGRVPKQY